MVRSIQCNIVNVLTHASVHKWGQDLFATAAAGVINGADGWSRNYNVMPLKAHYYHNFSKEYGS